MWIGTQVLMFQKIMSSPSGSSSLFLFLTLSLQEYFYQITWHHILADHTLHIIAMGKSTFIPPDTVYKAQQLFLN
jgi:hypothetical protein